MCRKTAETGDNICVLHAASRHVTPVPGVVYLPCLIATQGEYTMSNIPRNYSPKYTHSSTTSDTNIVLINHNESQRSQSATRPEPHDPITLIAGPRASPIPGPWFQLNNFTFSLRHLTPSRLSSYPFIWPRSRNLCEQHYLCCLSYHLLHHGHPSFCSA